MKKEETEDSKRRDRRGQLRAVLPHRSFPKRMTELCWSIGAASGLSQQPHAIHCQLIKLAFVISQKGRGNAAYKER